MTEEDLATTSSYSNETSSYDDDCFYEPPPMTDIRFWLVSVFGSTVSFISIVFNILLFYLFLSKRHHRTNHNMYMMLLAFFDIFVSTAYILLMSVNVLSDYLQSPVLLKLWYFYMVPMITISHIAMTASSNLIVCASFERYCLTLNSKILPFAQKNRTLIAGFAIFLGVVSKGTMCLEFEIYDNPSCEGTMSATNIGYRQFVFGTPYHVVWRFWYRNFVTIFAPFFILAYLNIRIVKALTVHTKMTVCQLAGNAIVEQAKRKMSQNPALNPARRKATARAATRTLVMVVCCYLISNIINVILTIWEHFDKEGLQSKYLNAYAIAVDLVSLLTTMACASRLPIYMACQVALRAEIIEIIKCITCRNKSKQIGDDEFLVRDLKGSTNLSRATQESSMDSKDTAIVPSKPEKDMIKSKMINRRISMEESRSTIRYPSEDDLKRCLNYAYETLL